MKNILTDDILRSMQEDFNGCPLFIDREKGDLDDLVGQELVVESYYELTGEDGVYYAIAFEGFEETFFLSGGALTALINKYGDAVKEVKLLIQEKVKTKKNRDYRPIRVLGKK